MLFKSLPQSLLTSSVIVPDNLIAQWIGEVYKHIADGELEFLVLDNKKQSIPPARKLLAYDLVIISHSRFGLESDSGGLEIVGKMSMRIYVTRSFLSNTDFLRIRYISKVRLSLHWSHSQERLHLSKHRRSD